VPKRIQAWTDALTMVDVSSPPAKRTGLWLPEPEFLITPETKLRLVMYLHHWLQARLPFLTLLNDRRRYPPLNPNTWRTFLGRFPGQTAAEAQAFQAKALASNGKKRNQAQAAKRNKEKDESLKTFSHLLSRTEQVVVERHPNVPTALHWQGKVISVGGPHPESLHVPDNVAREIAWEVGEMSFRVEVAELDSAVLPCSGQQDLTQKEKLLEELFPGKVIFMPKIPPPVRHLGASSIQDRAEGLEALRRLITRWPGCLLAIRSIKQLSRDAPRRELQDFEQAAAQFYCQTFFNVFGRASAVPRAFPC
jgi:hypothetical protein